ncbi:MAG: hypothetical protein HQL82_15420 [Magnetococcales bacterium]|nr:hypothetical protein [Magnetococcales bacterium]
MKQQPLIQPWWAPVLRYAPLWLLLSTALGLILSDPAMGSGLGTDSSLPVAATGCFSP